MGEIRGFLVQGLRGSEFGVKRVELWPGPGATQQASGPMVLVLSWSLMALGSNKNLMFFEGHASTRGPSEDLGRLESYAVT